MALNLKDRLQHAWNAFNNQPRAYYREYTSSSNTKPDRVRIRPSTEKSMLSALYNRIGIDASSVNIRHARVDEDYNFLEVIDSSLNNCLSVEANIDQTGTDLIRDAVISLCDEGSVAIVPVETIFNPEVSGGYDITHLRVGQITEWFPNMVRIKLYNEKVGYKEEIILPKKQVAIVENPLFMVMNEPNSTLKRLIHKLNLLDVVDEQASSGKLDIIVQLPYIIKSEARRKEAEVRRKDIEMQLKGSKYGIAYIDGSEKVTQLNRPAENNLMNQIEYLTSMLYSQLGLTEAVFNGTADEREMLNYYNRTVYPILTAITNAMNRTFLTKTARSQGQSIIYYRDAFKLVPVEQLAEIADKFTRNEILSSNEIRSVIGFRPSKDPKADQLINSNLNQSKEETNIEKGE